MAAGQRTGVIANLACQAAQHPHNCVPWKKLDFPEPLGPTATHRRGSPSWCMAQRSKACFATSALSCLTNGVDLWTEGLSNGLVLVSLEAFDDHLPAPKFAFVTQTAAAERKSADPPA